MTVRSVKSILISRLETMQWTTLLVDGDNSGGEQPVENDKEEEDERENSPRLLIDQVGAPPPHAPAWEVERAEGHQLGDADEEEDKAAL